MKLTEKDIIPFFPDDNRFIYFVARKHGFFFKNDDDVETVRFLALQNTTRMVSKEQEYESEAHLNSLIEYSVKNSILTMLTMGRALKRSMDVRVESEFFIEGNEESHPSPLERSTEDVYSIERRELIREIIDVVVTHETPKSRRIFELFIEGFNDKEIAVKVGMSQQGVQQRRKNTFKRLKNYYETDTWNHRANGKKVRRRVRPKPFTTNKAEPSSHSAALSYLGLI